jgi:hypothetical protein
VHAISSDGYVNVGVTRESVGKLVAIQMFLSMTYYAMTYILTGYWYLVLFSKVASDLVTSPISHGSESFKADNWIHLGIILQLHQLSSSES